MIVKYVSDEWLSCIWMCISEGHDTSDLDGKVMDETHVKILVEKYLKKILLDSGCYH